MVYLARILGYAKYFNNKSPRKFLKSGFLDLLPVKVKAGTGGFGLPRYGGIGGMGGSVYVRAKEGIDLLMVSKKLKYKMVVASMGENSQKKGIIGKPGYDVTIDVPPGIEVKTTQGIYLGEVNEPGSTLIVAKGGLGGNADNGFCGQKGQIHTILLDLKLIADVALVGFPNAGKSTLLKAVSGSKTKIAAYPFTTVKPHLGIMKYEDDRIIKMADLPGLIEGAHIDVGMGHKFLKHLERCRMMLFVIDIQGFQLSHKFTHRNCLETIILLNKEIELYKPELMNIPAMLLINKMDTANAQEMLKEIMPKINNLEEYVNQEYNNELRPEKVIKFEEIITTSLLDSTLEDVTDIKNKIRKCLDNIEKKKIEQQNEITAEIELYHQLQRKIKQTAASYV